MMMGGLFTHYNGADRKYIAASIPTALAIRPFGSFRILMERFGLWPSRPTTRSLLPAIFPAIGTVPRSHIARYMP